MAQLDRQPASKERQQQRDDIALERQGFVKNTLAQGEELLTAQQWSELSQLLASALDALPAESTFVAFDAERQTVEAAFVDQNTARLHLDESQYLLQITPTTALLATAFPNYQIHQAALIRLKARKKALSALLISDSHRAINRSQFDLAQAAVDRAMQLDPDSVDLELNAALLAEKRRRDNGIATLQAANRSLVIEALGTQFESAMRAGDLGTAQTIMARLTALDGDNPLRQQQQERLDQTVNTVITVGIKDGDEKYNAGDIAGALDIWNRIVSLQPKHSGLLERIARANRFLQRLEELQKAAPANGS